MATKFILPALALAGSAFAQSQGACTGSFTISSSSDTSQLSSCSTYDGDIIIAAEASGQINIDGVTRITGDLRASNATQLTGIGADRLATIEGMFDLEVLQIMSNLQMPYLNAVNRIRWIALPALQSLNFARGVTQANQVYISNTGLTQLSGIELTAVGALDVNNNQFLRTINVNNLKNVTSQLAFSANGPNLEIALPNLQSAANMTIRNVSSISMPSLSQVAGSMGFYQNYFSSFAAPNLTRTGNTIAFVDSPSLTSLEFPMLQTIGGGLLLANNSELDGITGFNGLKTINGDINFYGTFDAVSFNSLSDVKGAASVYTSSTNNSICDLFQAAKKGQAIKGKLTCETNSKNTAGNGSSANGGSGSSSSNKNSAADMSAPITGLFGLIAALLFI